ncbi:MAG: FkbM family methyltransferase [Hyphomonas sp.]|nr:FkbM family methyltransferase [Hyphomonas sp.]
MKYIKRLLLGPSRKIVQVINENRVFRGVFFEGQYEDSWIIADTAHGQFIVNTSDKVIGKTCYKERSAYDYDRLNLAYHLIPHIEKRRTLVDVGANIGTVSISALRSRQFQNVIAIEPEPNNFKALKLNTVLNDLEDRITSINVAVGKEEDENLMFELSETNHGDHRVRLVEEDGIFAERYRKVIQVKSHTLNSLMQHEDLETLFLWIDTQGYEGAVLSGASALIESRVPICFEFWPYGLQRSGGFDSMKHSLAQGAYRHLVDLNHPNLVLPFSVQQLDNISKRVGIEGDFTDVLVF